MELSNSEEQLMQILWKKEKAFMKDLVEAYPDPKPATNTVATLLKRMQDKKFVGYTQIGRSREYFPKVSKKNYFSKQMNGMIKSSLIILLLNLHRFSPKSPIFLKRS